MRARAWLIFTMAVRIATKRSTLNLHKEHKIAIGFVALVLGGYFGYQGFATYQVDRTDFQKLQPGRVSILGINAGAGYRIIVANQVAQLLQSSNENFDAAFDFNSEGEGDTQGTKKRVPLKELLETLQGNEEALGKFITSMNDDLKRAEMPSSEVLWTASDVRKAIAGDLTLKTKLEQDLNCHLDGTPLDQIRMKSINNGVVLVCRVPVTVSVAGVQRQMVGEVKIPYRPKFIIEVQKRYEKAFEISPEIVKGNYLDVAKYLKENPKSREDVTRSLQDWINEDNLVARFGVDPGRVLKNAFVALNESFIEGASFTERNGTEGKKLYDIEVSLNDEGRRRLWQYSRKHQGSQLLFIVDGIAIAAPRIRHELPQSTINITQIPDRSLVEDAVDLINSHRKSGS